MDGEKVNGTFDTLQAHRQDDGNAIRPEGADDPGVGAPHIRDRNYWVGHAIGKGLAQRERERGIPGGAPGAGKGKASVGAGFPLGGLANDDSIRLGAHAGTELHDAEHNAESRGSVRWMANAVRPGSLSSAHAGVHCGQEGAGPRDGEPERPSATIVERPGPTNGYWRDADWLGCTDGKWRPVEPGTFPLVASSSGRVGRVRAGWDAPAGEEGQGHRAGRLKGYGNAINAEAARVFIECVMEATT